MTQLVECVPNVSEGRDRKKIDLFARAISDTPGVALLHVDSNPDAHRTVFTYVGSGEALIAAGLRLFEAVASQIDMRQQFGAHPRIGAVDVVPFVPLENVTMQDCIGFSTELARLAAEHFEVPVYLYEYAASSARRRPLPNVRRGGFEGLSQKMHDPDWQPDFGPAIPHPTLGASVIGARRLLVAFNVELETRDQEIADAIARELRASGHATTRLPALRAIGWYMEQYAAAQVSMNLTDLSKTGMFQAFDGCRRVAASYGVKVRGSELIGLVPEAALIRAGRDAQGASAATIDAEQAILHAVREFGLKLRGTFELNERILERAIATHQRYNSRD
ncbi:MAG: glutamate formimidoyltransferase [Bdellovibrionales bacterium]|nr:glutamate formimidoyltransferase [Bdellovibrionales bacterium]